MTYFINIYRDGDKLEAGPVYTSFSRAREAAEDYDSYAFTVSGEAEDIRGSDDWELRGSRDNHLDTQIKERKMGYGR